MKRPVKQQSDFEKDYPDLSDPKHPLRTWFEWVPETGAFRHVKRSEFWYQMALPESVDLNEYWVGRCRGLAEQHRRKHCDSYGVWGRAFVQTESQRANNRQAVETLSMGESTYRLSALRCAYAMHAGHWPKTKVHPADRDTGNLTRENLYDRPYSHQTNPQTGKVKRRTPAQEYTFQIKSYHHGVAPAGIKRAEDLTRNTICDAHVQFVDASGETYQLSVGSFARIEDARKMQRSYLRKHAVDRSGWLVPTADQLADLDKDGWA